ncbi:MAG TPA: S8 family serine peptidase [Verrucomicrobiae bacterium]|nr:S8 family serine peptidase [Verrucomicrobiae bacterium]
MAAFGYSMAGFPIHCSEHSRTSNAVLRSFVCALLLCWIFFLVPSAVAENLIAPPYAPDRILIQPRRGVDSQSLAVFHKSARTTVLRTFSSSGLQIVCVPKGESVSNLIAKYQASGLVEFAEPDYYLRAAATIPNDPRFLDGTLWSLNNVGQNGGTPGADIHAIEGWDSQTSASNIVVAILDTGIRFTHEDLDLNVWVNTNDNTHGFNAFTESHDPTDDQGHGTLIAGILGGIGNNGIGVCGVAWRVQMMACKCLDEAGVGTDSSVIACLDFARTNGARIVNASFSGQNFSFGVSNALINLRDAGIIVVTPAGNSWQNVDIEPNYPACYPFDNIVSVGFSGNDDFLGFPSNYGATNVDLMAPGELVYSTAFDADDAYAPADFPHDRLLPSSSFAAAEVSGALALILEKFPDEDYRTSIRRLLLAVDRLPDLEGKCVTGGRLNLAYAFNPPIQLRAGAIAEDTFELKIETSPNRTFVIETSTDLANWNPISTNTTSIYGDFTFVDNTITNSPQQFYRLSTVLQ